MTKQMIGIYTFCCLLPTLTEAREFIFPPLEEESIPNQGNTAYSKEYNFPPMESKPIEANYKGGYYEEPSITYREPSAGYREPSAGYRDQSADYKEPSANYGTPSADYYKQPSVDYYKEPSAGYREPSAGYKEPSANYGEPSAGYKEPSANYGEPSAVYREPSANYYRKPSANTSNSLYSESGFRQPESHYPVPSIEGYQNTYENSYENNHQEMASQNTPYPNPYSNSQPSNYRDPQLTENKIPQAYRFSKREYEQQQSSTYFQRPGYKFPPLENELNSNAFTNNPIFPPMETSSQYNAYQVPYDAMNYTYPRRPDYSRPRTRRSYQRHSDYSDYGYQRFYDPYSYMSMPLQNVFPGARKGQGAWNPFGSSFNQMPFYSPNGTGDFSDFRMPGFFSK